MSEVTDYSKLKVTELKALCKEKGLPVSGTKQELIQRLSGDPAPAKLPKTKKAVNHTLEKPVFTNYIQNLERTPIIIKRNIHGNFEHLDTHLVFNADKKVIGIQDESGEITSLTVSDLEHVYKYHFELQPGVKVQDHLSSKTLVDESLKEKRVEELLELTNMI